MIDRRSVPSRQDNGFTLIELLVVIVIIGILAGIVIPVFLHQREKANDAGLEADLHNVAMAVETYYTDNDAFPASSADVAGDGDLDARVTVTNTVSLTRRPDGKSYCLKAANTHGDANSDWYYDSAAGGLLRPGVSCS